MKLAKFARLVAVTCVLCASVCFTFATKAHAEEIEQSAVLPVTDEEADAEYRFIERYECFAYAKSAGEVYDIDPYLLTAIAERESSLNANARNGKCKGIMQVSEKWHADRMERLGVENLYDAEGCMLVAADYLAELFEINSDPYYVLMRYNMLTSTANELYKKGEITPYALGIVERAEELKTQHKKAVEEYVKKQKELRNNSDLVPLCGGCALWVNTTPDYEFN